MAGSRRVRFATTFLRYWGANMQRYVWDQGHEWPGFEYGAEDKALLERWGKSVGASFVVFMLATVVLFILLAAAILAVVWGPILASDPAFVPAVLFLGALGAACVLSISVAMPLSMLGAALLAGRFEEPLWPDEEEVAHGLRVYRTVLGQIRRVGIIGGVLVPIGSFLMLMSTTFSWVITMLGTTIPWILFGMLILEGLMRMVTAPDR
jgi:hypothetical protein